MKVAIVDGNNLIARGTYVLPNAVTPDNRPIGGIYIALRMIRTFLGARPHDAVVVALDAGTPAYRFKVCPEYKAQRREERTPEDERIYQDYRSQVRMCHELFKPFGLVTARAKGWEGDDAVAALVLRRLAAAEVTIVSSDRDFTQLVDGRRIAMWDVGKECTVQPDPHFCLKRCMDPKPADNLDGVPGIGPAKADKLVEAFLLDRDLSDPEQDARTEPERFIRWCAHTVRHSPDSPIGKLCKKVLDAQQKLRANWRCTWLPGNVDEVDAALKFRRTSPDKAAAKAAIRMLGLAPLLDDFSAVWPAFAGLQCPV